MAHQGKCAEGRRDTDETISNLIKLTQADTDEPYIFDDKWSFRVQVME
jgi:hypothetical protein